VGVAAWQVLGATLEPDEKLRFTKLFGRIYTLSKNIEALRWAARTALGWEPADGAPDQVVWSR
jgi:hypothetical protein